MLTLSGGSRAPLRRRGHKVLASGVLAALAATVPISDAAAATTDTVAPSAPSSARVAATAPSSISLAWRASTDNVKVTGYRVWRGDAAYGNWVQVGTTGGGTLTFVDGSAPKGVKVHYGIRAVDAAGNISASSNIIEAATSSSSSPSPTSRPFFPGASWLWDRIPAGPALDPASASIASRLAGGAHVANLYDFGVPVYEADAATPRYSVDCLENWGECGLEKESVPVPAGAKPSPGDDGAMVVIDRSSGKSYEFWQYKFNNGRPTTSWGGVASLSGDGRGVLATGSGLSRLAGVVTIDEMRSGHIPHALMFSTDSACPSTYRYPATKTDGSNLSGGSVCLPEGTRIQLDPSVDVNALPGLTAGERVVARALQEYGAYAMDNGGSRSAFIFETPYDGADPYPGAGFGWDYYDMNKIPWNRLRVLRQWDGR